MPSARSLARHFAEREHLLPALRERRVEGLLAVLAGGGAHVVDRLWPGREALGGDRGAGGGGVAGRQVCHGAGGRDDAALGGGAQVAGAVAEEQRDALAAIAAAADVAHHVGVEL